MAVFLFFACGLIVAVWACSRHVTLVARQGVYRGIVEVPPRRVGLVLGCARSLGDGRFNLYFTHRIRSAAELYHAGKIEYLLVSGDNHVVDYNEPQDMRNALIEAGVPGDRVVCDYAGFRTLDSVVRANKVFGLTEFTVISQAFHVERAVFIGKATGLDVVGFCAQDVGGAAGLKTHLRERLARTKAFIDLYVIGKQPKFLGDPIRIGGVKDHLDDNGS